MPLPGIGTSSGAQAANISTGATSSATGTITFTGPSGLQGSVITCVVTVPNAPVGAVFTATLGTPGGQGVILDTWGGESTAGRFQILVGQTLVVTGTGLTPNTPFTCTFGTITDIGEVEVVIPDPNSSAILAQIGAASTIFSATGITPSGGAVTEVGLPVSPTVRTIVIVASIAGTGALANVQVVGGVTGNTYYNQPPYLPVQGGLPKIYTIVVPFISVADPTVTVVLTTSGSNVGLSIFGDTAQYDESVFYNGVSQTAAVGLGAAGTTTILTGPARLLTISLISAGATDAQINLNGHQIMRLLNAAAIDTTDVMTFPPNTILTAGAIVAIQQNSAGSSVGTVTWAYP